MRVLLTILIAVGLAAGRVPHSRAAEPTTSGINDEEWEKNAQRFDPRPCKPPLIVRPDNDLDINFDEQNAVGNAELPQSVARNISRLAEETVARQNWRFYVNRTCESFIPKAFRISVSSNLDLYAVMFREESGDTLQLFLHDKIKNVLSYSAMGVPYRAKDVEGLELQPPLISFADLRRDGSKQIVIQEPDFLTTFQFAATYRYYDVGPDLQFMQVFVRETRMSNAGDGWGTTFVRELTPIGKGRVKLTTKTGPKDGSSAFKEVGYAILQSRGPGDPFWITERHTRQRTGAYYFPDENYLIGIFAGSKENENHFMAGR